ncbi:MAG: hypothetical protein IPK19_36125 [Chloroflexi bacterium]|nr:hypothetical protein [Chloroflexota bacterium]
MPAWTTLTLQLQQIDDLFTAPQVTPFHAGYHALSGMDQLVAALDGQPLGDLAVLFSNCQLPRPGSSRVKCRRPSNATVT